MCTTRILANTANGFINQCTECNSIAVAFGTSLINFRMDEYRMVSNQVKYEVQHFSSQCNPKTKCIQIKHPSRPEFSLVLNINELNLLNTLVQHADIMLEAYNLLNDENQQ